MTSGSLRNLYRDKINGSATKNNDDDSKINNNRTITSKSFEYRTKLIGSTPDDNSILGANVVALLKYLSNFWRPLDFPLINCKIKSGLSWSKECIIF